MKKLLSLLVVVSAVAFAAAGAESLLTLLPDASCGVLAVDAAALWNHPQCAASLQKPEVAGELKEYEKMLGCKLTDIEEVLIFVDSDPGKSNYIGGLIRSRAASKLFAAAAKSDTIDTINRKAGKDGKEDALCNRVETIGGRKAVFFSDSAKPSADDVGLIEVTPEVLLVARRDILPKMLEAPRMSPAAVKRLLAARIPGKYPVWSVWLDPNGKTVEPPSDPKAPKIEDKIIGGAFAFGFDGKDQLNYKFVAAARCNTRNYASMLSMMIPGYAQMGVALAFQKNPELGQEILQHFRCSVHDFNVRVSLLLPQALWKKLEAYLMTEGKQIAVPADPVPADIKAK